MQSRKSCILLSKWTEHPEWSIFPLRKKKKITYYSEKKELYSNSKYTKSAAYFKHVAI